MAPAVAVPPAVAWPKLRAFAQQRGVGAVSLALHASVPLGLTPELLHLIRRNFAPEADFMSEADLLLSDLVRDHGGVFELDPEVRSILQRQLRQHPDGDGQRRLERVADFLYTYSAMRLRGLLRTAERQFLRAQQWAALSYLDPVAAAERLAEAIEEGLDGEDGAVVRETAAVTRALAGQLGGQGRIVAYAAGIERLMEGNPEIAERVFRQTDTMEGGLRVGRVSLPAGERVAERLEKGALPADDFGIDRRRVGREPEEAWEAPEIDEEEEQEEESTTEAVEPPPLPQTWPDVDSFEYDVWISYAQRDDVPIIEGEKGWVDAFRDSLEVRLRQLRGREITVWCDRKVTGGNSFPEELLQRIGKAAVFLPILSPSYLRSAWCRREFEAFVTAAEAQGRQTVRDRGRIFKVEKTPVPGEAQPPEARELLGYRFFESGSAVELMPGKDSDTRLDYFRKLDELCRDIAETLARIEEPPSAAGSKPHGPRAYLSYARDDLEVARRLYRELTDRGIEVWLDREEVEEDEQWHDESEQAIRGSDYFVVLNSRAVVSGADGFSNREIRLALERNQKEAQNAIFILPVRVDDAPLDKRLMDWQSVDLTSSEGVEQLVAAIRRDQEMRRAPSAPVVYLIVDAGDSAAVDEVANLLSESGIEVVLSATEGKKDELRVAHQENLRVCDAAMVYWGEGSYPWLRAKLRDIRKAPGYGRQRPFDFTAVVVGPPEQKGKDTLRAPDTTVIDARSGLEPKDIEGLLGSLRPEPPV